MLLEIFDTQKYRVFPYFMGINEKRSTNVIRLEWVCNLHSYDTHTI